MVDGLFLRGHGLNLYHLQYECLGYIWDPLDCCGTIADGRFLRGHGLNLYHLQYECLGLLSIWEPPLYTLVYRRCEMCIMPSWGISETPKTAAARWLMVVFCIFGLSSIGHQSSGIRHVGNVGIGFTDIYYIYYSRVFLMPRETVAYKRLLRSIALIWIPYNMLAKRWMVAMIWKAAINIWPSAISHQTPAISHRPSVIGHQPSAIAIT